MSRKSAMVLACVSLLLLLGCARPADPKSRILEETRHYLSAVGEGDPQLAEYSDTSAVELRQEVFATTQTVSLTSVTASKISLGDPDLSAGDSSSIEQFEARVTAVAHRADGEVATLTIDVWGDTIAGEPSVSGASIDGQRGAWSDTVW